MQPNRTTLIATGTVLAIFAIMTTGFVLLWQRASATYARIDDVNRRFDNVQLTLDEIRDELAQSSSAVIDCRENPEECATEIPSRISTLHASLEQQVTSLEQPLPLSERAIIEGLRTQMNDFWNSLQAVNSQDVGNALRKGQPVPSINIAKRPLRVSVDALVTDVDILSRANQRDREDTDRSLEHSYQPYLRAVILISLVLVMIAAAVGFFCISQIHQVTIREHGRSARAERELRALAQKLREVQEHERRQISRELHDEVGQILTGLRMELGSLSRLGSSTSPEYKGRLDHAKTLAEDAVRSIRTVAMGLRPPMLDDLGLEPALRWQAQEFSSRVGVPVHLDIRADLSLLPDRYMTCLYRVTQEALTNCAKHAGAKEVRVRLIDTETGIILTIEDDGAGFNPKEDRPAGLGLVGIEERARELNGRGVISPRRGGGTRVEVELPLPVGVA